LLSLLHFLRRFYSSRARRAKNRGGGEGRRGGWSRGGWRGGGWRKGAWRGGGGRGYRGRGYRENPGHIGPIFYFNYI